MSEYENTVDYEKGETPMTDYQFQKHMELRDENAALRKEVSELKEKLTVLEKELGNLRTAENK